jgi:uncharacterized protein YbbK (DUF523 family)/uncharacterized protein YbgA (DUF1722 family)
MKAPNDLPRIGMSSCLLGEPVRWDGGHKRDGYLVEGLAPFVEWVPVCPEVEMGLSVPREPIRIEEARGRLRLVGEGSGEDHGPRMKRFVADRLARLGQLDGYIFKANSPSCGPDHVKVHREGHVPTRTGQGFFASAVRKARPHLPVADEGELRDTARRENFIERVFAWRRVQLALGQRSSRSGLVAVFGAHELQLRAHDEKRALALGRRVRDSKSLSRGSYLDEIMGILARPRTRPAQAKVLRYVAAELKGVLAKEDRIELADAIEHYRTGRQPLLVPVTLLRHHVRVHGIEALQGQSFLEPDAGEQMLLNHA